MSTPWGPPGSPDPTRPASSEISPYGAPPHGGPLYDGAWGGPVDPHGGRAAAPLPGHNPYANPGSWEPARYLPRPGVPGTIVAGSVVGYVFAAFLFVTGLFLLFFGSIVPDSFDELDPTVGDSGVAFVLAGLGNWIALGLLVTGGVLASLRRPAGLVLTLVASALVVVLAVYWVVLYPDSGIVVWAVLHAAVGLLVAGLVVLPPHNRAWVAGDAAGPPPAPAGPPPFPLDEYGRPFGT